MAEVQAHITKVEQDPSSGWGKVFTDDDEIKMLKTKIAEKLQEAGALKKSGALALIEYTTRQGNINQHTGQPYIDHYYDRAGAIDVPDEDTGIDVVQPVGRKTDPEDAWRMCLNKGGELAVATLWHMKEEQKSFATQKRVAYDWAKFFFFTPLPPLEELAFGGGNGFGAGDSVPVPEPVPADAPPPHGDDDIPF